MFVKQLTLKRLVDYNIFIGHNFKKTVSSNYIYLLGIRNNIYFINIEYTLLYFRLALFFLSSANLYKRSKFCFLALNRFYSVFFKFSALKTKQYYYVNNWLNGFFSNLKEILSNRYVSEKLTNIRRLPSVVFCANIDLKKYIVNECFKSKIVLIGLVDSNIDPAAFFFPIPGNDDSVVALSFYCDIFNKFLKKNKDYEIQFLKIMCKVCTLSFVNFFMYFFLRLFKLINLNKRIKLNFIFFKYFFFFKYYDFNFDIRPILISKIFLNVLLRKKVM